MGDVYKGNVCIISSKILEEVIWAGWAFELVKDIRQIR